MAQLSQPWDRRYMLKGVWEWHAWPCRLSKGSSRVCEGVSPVFSHRSKCLPKCATVNDPGRGVQSLLARDGGFGSEGSNEGLT